MNRNLVTVTVLLLVMFVPSKSLALSEPVERWLKRVEERAKSEKDKKYASQEFVKRIESELSRVSPQYDFIIGCLSKLKRIDSPVFSKYVKELPEFHRRRTYFSHVSNFSEEDFFYFIKRFADEVSEKDGFDITAKIFGHRDKFLELAFFLFMKMKPGAYAAYFESNEKLLLKAGEKSVRALVEMYCLTKRLTGRAVDCVAKLSRYKTMADQPWLQLAIASAYLTKGSVGEAKSRIDKLIPGGSSGCAKASEPLGWAPFYAAQILRTEGNTQLSKLCLLAFSSAEKDNLAKFFFNFEMAKTVRAEDLALSEKFLATALQSAPKTLGYTFLNLLLDIEKLKNLAIGKDSESFHATRKQVDSRLSRTSLADYKQLPGKIEEFLLDGKVPSALPGVYFELLDLEHTARENLKKVESGDKKHG